MILGLVAAGVVLVIGCCTGLYIIGAEEQDKNTAASTTSAPALSAPSEAAAATQTPAEPTTAPPTVALSPTGPVVKTVAMPKVTGKNAAVADDELRKLGFTNIQYGSQDRDDKVVLLLSNWTVTKQSSKAGVKVKTDTLIVLTCTKQG